MIKAKLLLSLFSLLMPPPQYDHPHKGAVIRWRSYADVKAICHGGEACAFRIAWDNHSCLIIAYHNSPYGDANILRHEMGHCNGWPADHRGGHYE
jgi:hypothetical protein